jgi:hypothetical protein
MDRNDDVGEEMASRSYDGDSSLTELEMYGVVEEC